MTKVAKVFFTGRSQAVRLPKAFRFDCDEVFIRRDPKTGDIILSKVTENWDLFLSSLQNLETDDQFLIRLEREQNQRERDPLDDPND